MNDIHTGWPWQADRLGWQWNADCFIEERSEEKIILRNDASGALVALSSGEYELLQMMFPHPEAAEAADDAGYSDEELFDGEGFSVDDDTLQAIIAQAKTLELIVPAGRKRRTKRHSTLYLMLLYIVGRITGLLQHLTRQPLRTECTGNWRFFKLFSIHLGGGRLEKLATSRGFQKLLPHAYFAVLALLLAALLPHLHDFRLCGFEATDVSWVGLFFALLGCICLCLVWHETGHYVLYKRYDGTGNRMGAGLLFGFFPVFYTQIDEIHLWADRRRRMLLTGGGILADLIPFLALSLLLCVWHTPCFAQLLADCLFFYYAGQTFTNLNFFVPGTDGYYLFEELTGTERLYGRAYEACRSLPRHLFRRGQTSPLTPGEALLVLWFAVCCLAVTAYWLAVTLFFFFPLWSNLIV